MNDLIRPTLQKIITDYGRNIVNEPKRCEGLLRDLCPAAKREVNLLVNALKAGVATDLLTGNAGHVPVEMVCARLTRKLYDDLGLAEEFARWAVETWALALGVLKNPLPLSSVRGEPVEPRDTPFDKLRANGQGQVTSVRGEPVEPRRASGQPLQTSEFSFEIVRVDKHGTIIERRPGKATQYVQDLGQGAQVEMVSIPGGKFTMGAPTSEQQRSDAERPQHEVTLQPFWMGKYPVTQAQWQAVMGNNPSYFTGANRPVEQVSWDDAQEFLKKLNERTPPPAPPQKGGGRQSPSPAGRVGEGSVTPGPSPKGRGAAISLPCGEGRGGVSLSPAVRGRMGIRLSRRDHHAVLLWPDHHAGFGEL